MKIIEPEKLDYFNNFSPKFPPGRKKSRTIYQFDLDTGELCHYIYGWFRPPAKYLYIGSSYNGLDALLKTTHKVINKCETVNDEHDEIHLWRWFDTFPLSFDQLKQTLITNFRPKWNTERTVSFEYLIETTTDDNLAIPKSFANPSTFVLPSSLPI